MSSLISQERGTPEEKIAKKFFYLILIRIENHDEQKKPEVNCTYRS